jgi:hypothetical protein
MARRAKNEQAFSLFAFQDIIMSVTGIMILVTLILALELMEKVENSPTQRTQDVIENIDSTVASVVDLEQTVARNQARIDELKNLLAQGDLEIGEVAGFDQRAVKQDIDNMRQMEAQLASELAELAKRMEQSADQRAEIEEEHESIDVAAIKKMLDDVEQKKKDLEELKNRVIFNPTAGDAKTPWLVEITAQGITVAKTGVSAPPTKHASVNEFKAWTQQNLDKNRDYFVLLVKPDGIAMFDGVRKGLRQSGFDVGFDLLETDKVAIDPEKGAAAQ